MLRFAFARSLQRGYRNSLFISRKYCEFAGSENEEESPNPSIRSDLPSLDDFTENPGEGEGNESPGETDIELENFSKSRDDFMQNRTHMKEIDGESLRFINDDAINFSSEDPWNPKDVDSNLDDGELESNRRYKAYNEFYQQKLDAMDSDIPEERGPDIRKDRDIRGDRDYHTRRVIKQTGRTKDVEKILSLDGLPKNHIPKGLMVSDDSDVETASASEFSAIETFNMESEGRIGKIKKYHSPYWMTEKQTAELSDTDTSNPNNYNQFDIAGDNAMDEEDIDGAGSSYSSGEGRANMGPDLSSSAYQSSSPEDFPKDPYDDIDLDKRPRPPPPEHDALGRDDIMHQMLLKTGRHCKVTTGGRIFSTSALVLIGDGNGIGGLGYGKAETFEAAMKAAVQDAKKKLIAIHRVDNSVSYQSKQKYCRARVYVWPLAKKQGLRGSYKQQELCDLFGLTDIRIKTIGRRNEHNVYKALLRCLQTSETPEMHAQRRGKKVWDINRYWRVNNRSKGY